MRGVTLISVVLFAGMQFRGAHAQAQTELARQSEAPVELSTISPKLLTLAVSSGPVRVSSGIIAGSLVSRVWPTLPPRTNCLGVSGVVLMDVLIGTDGRVKSVRVISGADAMRQPNIDAVRQWVYRPFLLRGQPVEVVTTISTGVQFNREGCATP